MGCLQLNNNKIIININNIPKDKFIRAIRIRDIVKFSIMKSDEKQKLGITDDRDVKISSPSEKMQIINRNQIQQYKYLSGEQIKLAFLRVGKIYTGVKEDNTEFYVTLIPNNVIVSLNGKIIQGGKYIVAKNLNGEIDIKSAVEMSKSMFHKQFFIPRQDVISRNKGRKVKEFGLLIRRHKKSKPTIQRKPQQRIVNSNSTGINNTSTINNSGIQSKNSNVTLTKPDLANSNKQNTPKYKYKAIGTLNVPKGNNLERIGFVLIDRSGKQIQVREKDMYRVANLVQNIEVSRTANGQPYLRGTNCKIEELKKYVTQ